MDTTQNQSIYADYREVSNLDDCLIYHTIELPNYGLLKGQWDLRSGVDDYLGYVKFANKRVLEVGTANGFLCSEMEKRGAEMICYDLSENECWDIVPFGGIVSEDTIQDRKKHIGKLNNAWWLTHQNLNLKARMVYGSVYNIPQEIGEVDIATFGSILLHLRDPFLALQQAAKLTKETIIVTDILHPLSYEFRSPLKKLMISLSKIKMPEMYFMPNPDKQKHNDTWWNFSPELISKFLQVLGFQNIQVNYHSQRYEPVNRNMKLYTVVGRK